MDTSLDLWLLRVGGIAERSLDGSALDEEERRRGAAFIRAADRVRYLAGHIALRQVLGARLRVPPAAVAFTREPCPCCGAPHGRPAVADAPDGVHFSLSHGGDLVLIGLAAEPVGVDAEPLPAPSTVRELVGKLHPAEQADIAADGHRPEAFARIWTRKEAYLKGLGTGLARDLAADYVGARGTAGLPEGWTVTDVPVGDGHLAAAAVRGAVRAVRRTEIDPESLTQSR